MDSKADRREARRAKRRENWQTFRRTLPDAIDLARPYKHLWILGLTVLFISKLAGLVLPGTPKILLDVVLPSKDPVKLYELIAVVLAAATVQGLCSLILTQTISKTGQRLIAQLRVKIQDHVSRLSVRYYDDHRAGEVVSRVMSDVEGIRNLIGTGMVEFLGGIFTAVLGVAVLFYLNWQMTLTILVFITLFLVVLIKAITVLGPIYRERQKVMADVSGRLTESVNGIRIVKAYAKEDVERSVFAKGVDAVLHQMLRTINAISVIALTSSVLLGTLGAAVLFIGGRQLVNGDMTPGAFVSYLLYLGFIIAPVSSIVMVGTQFSEAFGGIQRMKEVLSESPEDREEEKKEPVKALEGRVEFRDVSFAYEETKPVLHDISFVAEPGTVTALVGASGSGKSTLIGLIAGFYMAQKGEVLVDGRNLSGLRLYDYRGHLGVVLQDNFLFSGTIRENLVYTRPDASEEDVLLAAKAAHCLEYIERFPDGFSTVIGERGVKLSGGQRQRLAIARALLADPRLLILDEATSALDSESEGYIQNALEKLMEGRTTFVIAHRLSTIRHADRILVLDNGRIVESGSHDELLEREGKYYDMYNLQHGIDGIAFPEPFTEEDATEEPIDKAKARRQRMAKLSKIMSGE